MSRVLNRQGWSVRCNNCGTEKPVGGFVDLPEHEQLREQGWHIDAYHGDFCPECLKDGDTA